MLSQDQRRGTGWKVEILPSPSSVATEEAIIAVDFITLARQQPKLRGDDGDQSPIGVEAQADKRHRCKKTRGGGAREQEAREVMQQPAEADER